MTVSNKQNFLSVVEFNARLYSGAGVQGSLIGDLANPVAGAMGLIRPLLFRCFGWEKFHMTRPSGWLGCLPGSRGTLVCPRNLSSPMKRLRRLLLALGLAYGAAAAAIAVAGLRDRRAAADLIVVPGNTVYSDGSLSGRLQARLDAAIQIFREGAAPTILVSGGIGREGRDEAAAMAGYLRAQGVPAAAIVQDPAGLDTAATARNAAQYLQGASSRPRSSRPSFSRRPHDAGFGAQRRSRRRQPACALGRMAGCVLAGPRGDRLRGLLRQALSGAAGAGQRPTQPRTRPDRGGTTAGRTGFSAAAGRAGEGRAANPL